MTENLMDCFVTKTKNFKFKELMYFVRKVDVEILGHGFKSQSVKNSLHDFMLPNFLLVYCLNGDGLLQHGSETLPLKRDSVCLLNPFEVYSIDTTSKHYLEYVFIYFDLHPFSARGNFQNASISLENNLFGINWTQTLQPYFKELCELEKTALIETDFVLQTIVRHVIVHTFYELENRNPRLQFSNHSRESEVINRAFAYVEKHLSEQLDVSLLVREIGISSKYLERAFSLIYKKSPLCCLVNYKMGRAIELLRHGKSVKEVAAHVGYSSSYYFSKAFKKVAGKSPTNYFKSF